MLPSKRTVLVRCDGPVEIGRGAQGRFVARGVPELEGCTVLEIGGVQVDGMSLQMVQELQAVLAKPLIIKAIGSDDSPAATTTLRYTELEFGAADAGGTLALARCNGGVKIVHGAGPFLVDDMLIAINGISARDEILGAQLLQAMPNAKVRIARFVTTTILQQKGAFDIRKTGPVFVIHKVHGPNLMLREGDQLCSIGNVDVTQGLSARTLIKVVECISPPIEVVIYPYELLSSENPGEEPAALAPAATIEIAIDLPSETKEMKPGTHTSQTVLGPASTEESDDRKEERWNDIVVAPVDEETLLGGAVAGEIMAHNDETKADGPPPTVARDGQVQIGWFDLGQILVEMRNVVILWLSVVLASVGVLLERYIRGKGWESLKAQALNSSLGIFLTTNLCESPKSMYFDDASPDLAAPSSYVYRSMTIMLTLMFGSIGFAFSLRCAYILRKRFTKRGSLKAVFEKDLFHRSNLRYIHDLSLVLALAVLTVGSIVVAGMLVSYPPHLHDFEYYDAYYPNESFSQSGVYVYVFQVIVTWAALFDVVKQSSYSTVKLAENAPEDVHVPEIWYIPNSQIVEAVISISMIPAYLFEQLKDSPNHPDFPHINQRLLKALTLEQLRQIKLMWKNATGVAGRQDCTQIDLVYNTRSTMPSSSVASTDRFVQRTVSKIACIIFSSHELVLFWATFFCLSYDAASLYALPVPAQGSDCISLAIQREMTVRKAFFAFGIIGVLLFCGSKFYLDFIELKGLRFGSFEFLLHMEYRRKDPWNKLLAVGMISFASLVGFMIFVIGCANSYEYPVSRGMLFISLIIMLHGGLQIYFHTSIVGMQHVKNRIPDVDLPFKFWTSSSTMLNSLLAFSMCSDEELRVIGEKVRAEIEEQQHACWMPIKIRRALKFLSTPGYAPLDAELAVECQEMI